MNNDIRSEVSKYNLPYNKLTIKSGVKIVDDRIVIKNKNNNDIDKTYNYLRSRAFDYFPYPIEESNKYEIYPYIEDVYEPYLIQIGFIARTLRGRMVLPPAYKHLGYDYKGE